MCLDMLLDRSARRIGDRRAQKRRSRVWFLPRIGEDTSTGVTATGGGGSSSSSSSGIFKEKPWGSLAVPGAWTGKNMRSRSRGDACNGRIRAFSLCSRHDSGRDARRRDVTYATIRDAYRADLLISRLLIVRCRCCPCSNCDRSSAISPTVTCLFRLSQPRLRC